MCQMHDQSKAANCSQTPKAYSEHLTLFHRHTQLFSHALPINMSTLGSKIKTCSLHTSPARICCTRPSSKLVAWWLPKRRSVSPRMSTMGVPPPALMPSISCSRMFFRNPIPKARVVRHWDSSRPRAMSRKVFLYMYFLTAARIASDVGMACDSGMASGWGARISGGGARDDDASASCSTGIADASGRLKLPKPLGCQNKSEIKIEKGRLLNK